MFSKLLLNSCFQCRIPLSTVLNVPQSRDPFPSREYTSVFSWSGRSCSSFAELEDLGINLLLIPTLPVIMLLSPSSKPNSSVRSFVTAGVGTLQTTVILPAVPCQALPIEDNRGKLEGWGKKEGTSYFWLSSYCCEQHPAMLLHFSSSSSSNRKLVCSFSNTHGSSFIMAPHQRHQHQLSSNTFPGVWVTTPWVLPPSFQVLITLSFFLFFASSPGSGTCFLQLLPP